ncbi:MAG: recombinase family protein [Bacillota bacterium]|nr:recombinase family protein [Bacillota bacterium]
MFKFMLTILGAVAEMERELTVERIREGMAKAKRYGTRSGRPVGRPPREIPVSLRSITHVEIWGYNSNGLCQVDWGKQTYA